MRWRILKIDFPPSVFPLVLNSDDEICASYAERQATETSCPLTNPPRDSVVC